MTNSLAQRHSWWLVLGLVAGFILFALAFIFPQRALAFENPHLYYDWNTYYDTSEQVLGLEAFAQEATPEAVPATPAPDYHDYKQFDGYFLGFTASLNPDDGFYFLKRFQENVSLTFTFDVRTREDARLEIAGERLSEMEAMAQDGKVNFVTSLASAYNSTVAAITDNLTRLSEQNQDVVALLAATDFEAAKHVLVLEEVSLVVPAQAQQGIETALAASERIVDTVADLADRPAVPPEMVTRLQALKAQGLLTEEEVAALVALDSRVAVREELRELAEARVLPEADFKKLDEAARSYFPAGFANIIEIKKFQELKDLETKRPDDATIARLQSFADTYRPGDIVPPDLRRWWVPMVRLEELQNTFRPDLIDESFFRNRPDDAQKYRELVERVKPRAEDIDYVNRLVAQDPSVLSDPAYARIKALADKFGSAEGAFVVPPAAASCSRDAHWVALPFMPNGGYCVPNLVYAPVSVGLGQQGSPPPCPPGYHRNDPLGACYPDNPYGPGAGPTVGPVGRAFEGFCASGYHWVPLPQTGGYCAPDSPSIGGGPYPGPIPVPSYCPSGQVFRDGKCETYNPPPPQGCPQGQFWTGQKCIEYKQCPAGQYQGPDGECKQSTGGGPITCSAPSNITEVCGFNAYWDYASCTCKSTLGFPGVTGVPGGYPTPSGGTYNCGAGYYWTGSYCAPTTGGYPTPSGTYGTPSYGTPSSSCPSGQYIGPGGYCISGSYPTPYYGTPSGTYGTPSYGTPTGDYPTPSYGTPSYGTPTYGTPEYPTPSYGTPSYGTPTYGTP